MACPVCLSASLPACGWPRLLQSGFDAFVPAVAVAFVPLVRALVRAPFAPVAPAAAVLAEFVPLALASDWLPVVVLVALLSD